jgi:hypothetical protein
MVESVPAFSSCSRRPYRRRPNVELARRHDDPRLPSPHLFLLVSVDAHRNISAILHVLYQIIPKNSDFLFT